MKYHNVLVVGAGLAGLRAAIEVNKHNVGVAVFSKVHPLRSHSLEAQGGINAALGHHPRGANDSVEKHAYDTIKGSDFLADQEAVMRMTKLAPERIYEMEHWGCPFSRTPDGLIAQRPFGGAGFPRTCFAADRTGHVLLHTLYEQVCRFVEWSERAEMKLYDEWVVVSLIQENNVCRGVVAMNLVTGELEAFQSEAVIFATGGTGRIYNNTTNALINTGLGMAIPFWEGVPLKDMEFFQFHPTTLVGTNILMTEGCRGEGGYLTNNKGERFLANYPDSRKAMEVAPRDIVSRNITREIQAGRGFQNAYVHLDLRHLGEKKIVARLPEIRELSINFAGVDPVVEPMPVQPGAHYSMGGIDCNGDCLTPMEGLYAAGECACVSVHGANRLGGNSLLETIVFGQVAGESAAKFVLGKGVATQSPDVKLHEAILEREKQKIEKIKGGTGKENPFQIKKELQDTLSEKAGIFRDEKGLTEAVAKVRQLKERFRNAGLSYKGNRANFALLGYLDVKGSLDVAECLTMGALARKESRGSHFRTDFGKRDDKEWLKHTVATLVDGEVKLGYKEVNLAYYPPAERKY